MTDFVEDMNSPVLTESPTHIKHNLSEYENSQKCTKFCGPLYFEIWTQHPITMAWTIPSHPNRKIASLNSDREMYAIFTLLRFPNFNHKYKQFCDNSVFTISHSYHEIDPYTKVIILFSALNNQKKIIYTVLVLCVFSNARLCLVERIFPQRERREESHQKIP